MRQSWLHVPGNKWAASGRHVLCVFPEHHGLPYAACTATRRQGASPPRFLSPCRLHWAEVKVNDLPWIGTGITVKAEQGREKISLSIKLPGCSLGPWWWHQRERVHYFAQRTNSGPLGLPGWLIRPWVGKPSLHWVKSFSASLELYLTPSSVLMGQGLGLALCGCSPIWHPHQGLEVSVILPTVGEEVLLTWQSCHGKLWEKNTSLLVGDI